MQGIREGQLYVVYVLVPCVRTRTNGQPPNMNGIGNDGGLAEYIVVEQSQLAPVVRLVSYYIVYTVREAVH